MRKLLLSTLTVLTGTVLFAQKNEQVEQAAPTANLEHRIQMDQDIRAVGCSDTIYYGELKQLRVGRFHNPTYVNPLYFFGLWQVDQEAISQTFLFDGGTMNLDRVIIPGRVNPTYSQAAIVTVAVEVFNVDANNVPTTLIGSTSVTMNSYAQSIFYANFSTPIAITGNYAISIRPTTLNSVVDIVTNDYLNNQPWDEDFCKLKSLDPSLYSLGNWVTPQTFTQGFPNGSRNFDLCIAPIVSYTADAVADATPTVVCLGDEVQFNGTVTPSGAFNNRVMSYQAMMHHFGAAAVDSTYAWNVNTTSGTFIWGESSLTHVYASAGNFNTRFYAIGGMYSRCILNIEGPMIRVVNPASVEGQVQLTAATTSICEGGSAVALEGIPAGGNYGGNFVNGSEFEGQHANTGTHSVTYTVVVDACEITRSVDIVVHANPVVTFGAVAELCADGAIHILSTGLPTGGAYSGVVVENGAITPSVAGVGTHLVTYTYSENGCQGTAEQEIEVVLCLNTDQLIANSTVVYPNPATQAFMIAVNTSEVIEFTLISLEGKVVYNNLTLNAGVNNIDVKGLSEGVYIVRLQSGNDVQMQKITLN